MTNSPTQLHSQMMCRHTYTVVTRVTVESTNRREGTACQATTVLEVMCSQCGDLLDVEALRKSKASGVPPMVPAT
jgi:hypothetical protein